MPAKKKQHYVPQFYFRLFSQNGKQIELYNLKGGQSFTGPIEHLCSEKYFYSKEPQIEEAFGLMENRQAQVIKSIIETRSLKPLSGYDYIPLYSLIALQHSRTVTSKIQGDQLMEHISDEIVSSLIGPDADVRITYPAMHLMIIVLSLQTIPLLSALGAVLLINNTNKNFIFSDNPVVFYNTYFNRVRDRGLVGIRSPGLQIFCPLNKELALFLYDVQCYSTRLRGEDFSTVPINSDADVESINSLQFINCYENIFYSDKGQKDSIKILHDKMRDLVGKNKMVKKRHVFTDDNGKRREFVHLYHNNVPYDLNLSFLLLNANCDETRLFRNKELVEMVRKDMDEAWRAAKTKSKR